MLLSQEVERIEKGEPVCLDAIASAWAERRIRAELAEYGEVHVLGSNLAHELQIAIRNEQLNLYDTFRKKERRYRSDDEPDLAKLRVWLLPRSVDAWLTKEGFEPAVPIGLESQKVEADEIDFSLLATREQLIEAFGRFTDMNTSWFKNLKDTPALLAARKHKGQGGRGHIDEPLFCPFEVMQWVASDKRRKGRMLGAEKAWELLEKNFPTAYNFRSIGDPRPKD